MKKRIFLMTAALVAIAIGVVGFSAFEAHVVNVTATIENALTVPVDPINYGTVFPQEQLDRQITVALSDSFKTEGRVEDVQYIIRQKPKCAITTNNGTSFDPLNTATGHVSLDALDKPVIDCGPAPRVLVDGETWGVLPSLCQYLSKHKVDQDNQTQEVEIPAFHQPYTFANHQVVWNEANGYLVKPSDLSDTWNIDLKVPCFSGQCGQDWANFVHAANAAADPNEFIQATTTEHKVFGCDLWFEVTGVSEADGQETQKVGANLATYIAPSLCDITVGAAQTNTTIQQGVDAATAGQTVCVEDGTYNEQVNVNKSLVLASLNGPSNTATISDGVMISSSDVTLKGFIINPGSFPGEIANIYLGSNLSNITIQENDINGLDEALSRGIVVSTGGTYSNVVIKNSKIHDTTTGIYTNPHTGILDIFNNDIYDNSAGIGGISGVSVHNNQFTDTVAGAEAVGADSSYDGSVLLNNNFLNGSRINDYGAVALISAENNFFNTGGINQTTAGEVDFTPEAGAPYAHN